MDEAFAADAANSLGNEIAAVDEKGQIVWANAAWVGATRVPGSPLAGAAPGANAFEFLRARGHAGAGLARAIADVIAGELARYVAEVHGTDARRWVVVVLPLRTRRGAVLINSGLLHPTDLFATAPDPADLESTVERLTPRERDVLALMVDGLSNRAIAQELGVAYTTVRSHTRSLIEKLGARSRLQAVARAHRAGVRGRA